MGFFSRKPALTPDEILDRMNSIEELLNQDNYQDAYNAAVKLEKEARGYGSYHLGVMHHLGWGVEEDYDKAINYYEAATSIDNTYLSSVWFMGGLLYLNQKEEPDKAAEWLEKAEALGESDAPLWLANAWARSSLNYREYACRTLRMNELTQANLVATNLAVKAQNKYMSLAQENPDSIDYVHMTWLGRCVQLLYNMACRGELSMDVTADNSFGSWLSNSFNSMAGSRNEDFHAQLLANAAHACAVIEDCGHPIVAEYFRAACGLLDAELHHSAEALYRVRWHMKHIGELRAQDPEMGTQVHELLTDVDEAFSKMEKKYGNQVISMMRQGQLPDITPSYPADRAPDPESCESFMNMLKQVQSTSSQPAPENKEKKKGLLGFFRK